MSKHKVYIGNVLVGEIEDQTIEEIIEVLLDNSKKFVEDMLSEGVIYIE